VLALFFVHELSHEERFAHQHFAVHVLQCLQCVLGLLKGHESLAPVHGVLLVVFLDVLNLDFDGGDPSELFKLLLQHGFIYVVIDELHVEVLLAGLVSVDVLAHLHLELAGAFTLLLEPADLELVAVLHLLVVEVVNRVLGVVRLQEAHESLALALSLGVEFNLGRDDFSLGLE
jgi:hypothetical protein